MTFKPLLTAVIDDEPDIRQHLKAALQESIEFEVIGEAGRLPDAIDVIMDKAPDVLFLDIQLQEGTAFDLLRILKRTLQPMPAVVINTGHTKFEYASRAINEFGDCVVQILQKPFWEDWDTKKSTIVDAIYRYQQTHTNSVEYHRLESTYKLLIQSGAETIFVEPQQIVYLETGAKGSKTTLIHMKNGVYTIKSTLNKLLPQLPEFIIQINRFTAINIKQVTSFHRVDQTVRLHPLETSLGIGDVYLKHFWKALS